MDEDTGLPEHLGEDEIRFTVSVDGLDQTYGPYDAIGRAMWDGGFVAGWLGAHGYRPSDIVMSWFVNGKLTEVTTGEKTQD
jgi:hypothetical protein